MEEGLISVDRWKNGSQAYFLTHLHSDHTAGLSPTWSHGPIYCSSITALLFPFRFLNFDESIIRVIDTGTWYTLSLVSPSSGQRTTVEFIAIDACHCPGSLMLLFRGEFGCVLYTGDFRWEAGCERAMKAKEMLMNAVKDDVVDVVYVDNTYCNPTYDFPSRRVAAQQIIDIISSHPDQDVIIGINNLGKEDLLLQIAEALKIKIWVWPQRLRTMHLLGFRECDIFTTDTSITRVRAVPQYSFSIDTLEQLNEVVRPTIGIMASGLPWAKKSLQNSELILDSISTSSSKRARLSADDDEVQNDKQIGNKGSFEKLHKYIYSVPYSDHSCFSEIEDFIKLVKPTHLKGIVSSSSCYIEPMYYFSRVCQGNRPIQLLHDKLLRKESGKRVGAVSNKESFGDGNAEPVRIRGKSLKIKFPRVRVSRLSILRRKRRGVKILENVSADED